MLKGQLCARNRIDLNVIQSQEIKVISIKHHFMPRIAVCTLHMSLYIFSL